MRLVLTLLCCAVVLAGCQEPDGSPDRSDPLAAGFDDTVSAVVQQQIDDGVPASPLGRVLDTCPALDDQGLAALAAIIDVAGEDVEILRATVSDPGGANTLSCPLRFSEASAGAIVLSVGPTADTVQGVRDMMVAQDFEEVEVDSIQGLPPEQVLLFDATRFMASRAIWTRDGFQISLTANADIVDEGRLLALLPVAVAEVTRVLG
ncbi:MAG: hypothetical protein ACR2HR_15375 [Euzebya sp.]